MTTDNQFHPSYSDGQAQRLLSSLSAFTGPDPKLMQITIRCLDAMKATYILHGSGFGHTSATTVLLTMERFRILLKGLPRPLPDRRPEEEESS